MAQASIESIIIGTVICIGAVGLIVIIVYGLHLRFRRREVIHRERLAALEKGVDLPSLPEDRQPAPWTPRVYLLRGMIWLFAGIAILMALTVAATTTRRPTDLEFTLWYTQRMRQMGANEQQINEGLHQKAREQQMPLAVPLIGLIPVGVGVAYLLFYRVEQRARKGE